MPGTAHPENRSHEADLLAAAVRQRRCCLSIRSFNSTNSRLLLQVNRSGFHYILDRIVGKFLLAEPSVDAATDETLWRFEANRIG